MSQLIRSLAPFGDSSVLITVKELITGFSVDFSFSSSGSFKKGLKLSEEA